MDITCNVMPANASSMTAPDLPALAGMARRVLSHLDEFGPTTSRQLSICLHVSCKTIQKAVRQLKEQSLVMSSENYKLCRYTAPADGAPQARPQQGRASAPPGQPKPARPPIAPAAHVSVWTPTGPALRPISRTTFHKNKSPWA